jgi:hypothetical protein
MVRVMKMKAESKAARLARARDYPYFVPDRSYMWQAGQPDAMAVTAFDPALAEGRTPVLAVGSNQSPLQLARKYGGDGDHAIPVQRATLRDFDVVYASHISTYGAVPAMLQRAPGVAVTLFVTWLDEPQLDIMHATEGNYHFAEIAEIDLALEGGGRRDSVYLYVAQLGHLVRDGAATGLRAVPAHGRKNGESTTADMLRHVQDRLGVGGDHDAFVLRLIEDEGYRRECIDRLSEDAAKFDYPFRVLGS